jgi:hypothetical protein
VSRAPDLIEPFVGWKGMLADAEGGLWSPQRTETFWPVGEPLIAKCHNKNHKPPVTGCMCGIYAVKTFDDLMADGYNWGQKTKDGRVWVIAEVALYGQVRRGAIGWRASKAAPQAIYVSAMNLSLGARIRKRYGVDLGMIDRFTGKRTLIGGKSS